MKGPIGRLAPSPTGLLHLGNAWAFWLAWLDVRARGGRLILRMEDLDPERAKEQYAQAARRDLGWLGLDWDGEARPQSLRLAAYEDIVAGLSARGLVYRCYCTRKELRTLAGAPQVGDAGAPYPGTCRRLSPAERAARETEGRRAALRLITPPDEKWDFEDRLMGRQSTTLAQCGGDFALLRSDGVFAYQLAVVADDIEGGVTEVVRGGDILASTPRQLYLYSLLKAAPPRYAHLPLVCDHEGERLAKRHRALGLSALREAGVKPGTAMGFLALLGGLIETYRPLGAAELLQRGFRLEAVKNRPLILPPDPAAHMLKLQD